jgi:hypothetical protein
MPIKFLLATGEEIALRQQVRLYDFLESKLGTELIFKDVDNIPYGKDFKEEIRKAIDKSKVVLVIIGRRFYRF